MKYIKKFNEEIGTREAQLYFEIHKKIHDLLSLIDRKFERDPTNWGDYTNKICDLRDRLDEFLPGIQCSPVKCDLNELNELERDVNSTESELNNMN